MASYDLEVPLRIAASLIPEQLASSARKLCYYPKLPFSYLTVPRMQSLKEFAIKSFLRLARINELAQTAGAIHIDAKSFPVVMSGDFFDPALFESILEEFPKPGVTSAGRCW